ncbi:hypothetical protein HPB52_000855 [Rhipicephalus sanguineus]|uniref:DUF7789 domain-containing protein n=1 Tax=Rhipicephalus sanguineus TaxID=34632 RepID=A0A9D4PTH9_RHISA|nr:hypothetical protein HPB52_000855 [Rhipicephalus sanguineus]
MGSLQNAVGAESGTAASGRESPPASFSQLGIPTGPDLRNTTLFGPVRLGVAVFFLLGIIYLGGRVAHGYWSERRLLFRINAKEDLQAMLGWLFLCSSLIFFDVQLQGTMLIFVMNHGTDLSRTEIIVLAVGPVVTVLWAIAGECTIRKESKIWLSIFVLLWFPNVVYIGLKLYDASFVGL